MASEEDVTDVPDVIDVTDAPDFGTSAPPALSSAGREVEKAVNKSAEGEDWSGDAAVIRRC